MENSRLIKLSGTELKVHSMVHSPYRFIAGVFACIALLTVRAQQIAPSLVWEKLYDDSACDIYTIVEAEDGGYVLGGRIYDGAGPNVFGGTIAS